MKLAHMPMKGQNETGRNFNVPPPGKNNQWYRYSNSDQAIIFVHGILSDSSSCWMSTKPPSPVYWPEFVARDDRFENASIYLGGYYTATDSRAYGTRPAADELFSALKRIEERA